MGADGSRWLRRLTVCTNRLPRLRGERPLHLPGLGPRRRHEREGRRGPSRRGASPMVWGPVGCSLFSLGDFFGSFGGLGIASTVIGADGGLCWVKFWGPPPLPLRGAGVPGTAAPTKSASAPSPARPPFPESVRVRGSPDPDKRARGVCTPSPAFGPEVSRDTGRFLSGQRWRHNPRFRAESCSGARAHLEGTPESSRMGPAISLFFPRCDSAAGFSTKTGQGTWSDPQAERAGWWWCCRRPGW